MTGTLTLHNADNRDILRQMIADGAKVHSVVCDPPYFLESVVKRFGKAGSAPAKPGSDGRFTRQSKGFMGRAWDGAEDDGTRIAFDPEFWALIYDVLLPGGYVLAFSSPRTGHWQACAMETAGFIMHPFLGWLYGSGFPKAHSLSKALEAQALTGGGGPKNMRKLDMGAEYRPHALAGTPNYGDGRMSRGADTDRDYKVVPGLTTPESRQWEGWFYGTQSLKPALEPIYMAQKPFETKTGFANVLMHGTGAVNIDGCRVAADGLGRVRENEASQDRRYTEGGSTNFAATPGPRGGDPAGRWPANFLHDGSPEVVGLFPTTTSGTGAIKRRSAAEHEGNTGSECGAESRPEGTEMLCYGDTGSAARFYNSFPGDPIRYQAKAGKADRAGSKHPTVKPKGLMEWLCRLVTPPGGTVLDPFAGSGTTGAAALAAGFSAILIEREPDYFADIQRRFGLSQITDDMLDILGPADAGVLCDDDFDLIG